MIVEFQIAINYSASKVCACFSKLFLVVISVSTLYTVTQAQKFSTTFYFFARDREEKKRGQLNKMLSTISHPPRICFFEPHKDTPSSLLKIPTSQIPGLSGDLLKPFWCAVVHKPVTPFIMKCIFLPCSEALPTLWFCKVRILQGK